MIIKYIILEGCNYSGKTTLAKKLFSHYSKQHLTYLTSEPFKLLELSEENTQLQELILPYLHIRKEIRNTLFTSISKNNDINYFFNEDRKLNLKILSILNKFKSDIVVIQDRSYISNLVYQSLFSEIEPRILLDNYYRIVDELQPPLPTTIIFNDVLIDEIVKRKKRINKNYILNREFISSISQIGKVYSDMKIHIIKNPNLFLLNQVKIVTARFRQGETTFIQEDRNKLDLFNL